MKNVLLYTLFVMAGSAVCAEEATQLPVEQKVVEIHMTRKTPSIEESKSKKQRVENFAGHATCSGEFISPNGYILTAGHCVEGFDAWEVQTYDGQKFTAVVAATSTQQDLALLHIDHFSPAYFRLADKVTRGEQIFVLGSPLTITNTLSTGIVAKLAGDKILIDCGALPGNSGGPVYNQNQELVGVLVAGYIVGMGTTHLNLAQSLESVFFFLTSTLNHGR